MSDANKFNENQKKCQLGFKRKEHIMFDSESVSGWKDVQDCRVKSIQFEERHLRFYPKCKNA